MTQPLRNTKVGRSEFSHGEGMLPHPESDYQSFRKLPWETLGDKHFEEVGRLIADRRTDYTDTGSGGAFNGETDLFFVEGNPDAFGPGPKLVKEGVQRPSGNLPQPVFRTGVIREE
jgi:hypothetical protein